MALDDVDPWSFTGERLLMFCLRRKKKRLNCSTKRDNRLIRENLQKGA